ncbi:LysR family transcriptional regulator, partial [Pseudomonas syringae pv. tagetis]
SFIATHGMPDSLLSLDGLYCVSTAYPGGSSVWRLRGPDAIMHEVQIASRFNANTEQALRKATLAGLGIALLPGILIR